MRATYNAVTRYAPDAAADHLNARDIQTLPLGTQRPPLAPPVASPAAVPVASPVASPVAASVALRVAPFAPAVESTRLRWLENALVEVERRGQLFRDAREEEEMLLMRRPLAPERAYALFGLLLGTLPPAAFVLKFATYFLTGNDWSPLFLLLLFGVPMTLICALTGRRMGRRLAPMLERAERRGWSATILYALWAGFVWACTTGAAGGAVVLLFGAFYGAACALPFGLAGFLLFAICHRLLARGGMMDARHFWPVASGIALASAALILGQ